MRPLPALALAEFRLSFLLTPPRGCANRCARSASFLGSVVRLSPLSFRFGPLAQLVEQLTLNQLVRGSNPRRPTMISSTYPFSVRCFFI